MNPVINSEGLGTAHEAEGEVSQKRKKKVHNNNKNKKKKRPSFREGERVEEVHDQATEPNGNVRVVQWERETVEAEGVAVDPEYPDNKNSKKRRKEARASLEDFDHEREAEEAVQKRRLSEIVTFVVR
ncbi:unnamed protein product [Cylindrotheca closterium]|uniref:Uncharacterized protein n=1 Tax=Cylindrotheca closterium TaxID=2856 RepID=A0AAD2FUQ4_9STRA|nr:unnamed protein product [Cylindrotheca closterium]